MWEKNLQFQSSIQQIKYSKITILRPHIENNPRLLEGWMIHSGQDRKKDGITPPPFIHFWWFNNFPFNNNFILSFGLSWTLFDFLPTFFLYLFVCIRNCLCILVGRSVLIAVKISLTYSRVHTDVWGLQPVLHFPTPTPCRLC